VLLQADNFTTIEVSGVRKVIAKRLTESKQTVPHSYSSIDCCIGKVLDLRKQLMKGNVAGASNGGLALFSVELYCCLRHGIQYYDDATRSAITVCRLFRLYLMKK